MRKGLYRYRVWIGEFNDPKTGFNDFVSNVDYYEDDKTPKHLALAKYTGNLEKPIFPEEFDRKISFASADAYLTIEAVVHELQGEVLNHLNTIKRLEEKLAYANSQISFFKKISELTG
jgi:hypothetical protein